MKIYKPLNKKELDEMWEKISTGMDIDEVWSGISSDLDAVMPVDSGSGIIIKSIAAILVILTGMIPVKKGMMVSGINKADIPIEIKQNDQIPEPIAKNEPLNSKTWKYVNANISPTEISSLDESGNSTGPIPEVRLINHLAVETPITIGNSVVSNALADFRVPDSNQVITQKKVSPENADISPAFIPDELKKIDLVSKTDFDSLKLTGKSSGTGSSFLLNGGGRISGGIITLFKNTWLLNHETFDGLKSETLTTTEIVFFPDMGLSLNYSLNKTWLLQADGFFYSNSGQDYLGYYNGHYYRKQIKLRYSTIDLSIKHKFIGISRFIRRSSINLLAGGYLSVLHSANQKINTDLKNIRSQYRKFDVGVRLGGEFELQIFDQLSIVPGLFLTLGIPNIYKGDSNTQDYLRKTHNGSAEFQLGFFYHFD